VFSKKGGKTVVIYGDKKQEINLKKGEKTELKF
jgi:alpha-L-fucosidase 2